VPVQSPFVGWSRVRAARSRVASGGYLTLVLGQTLTFKGSPCWCSSSPPSGDGSPCASIIVERYDDRWAACRGQGSYKIRT